MSYTDQHDARLAAQFKLAELFPHCAWDPCAEEPYSACEHCHTRLYGHDMVYIDKRGAFLGCGDCVEETFDFALEDSQTGEEIVEAGEWRSVALMDWEAGAA